VTHGAAAENHGQQDGKGDEVQGQDGLPHGQNGQADEQHGSAAEDHGQQDGQGDEAHGQDGEAHGPPTTG
jgi:hypothetical protein